MRVRAELAGDAAGEQSYQVVADAKLLRLALIPVAPPPTAKPGSRPTGRVALPSRRGRRSTASPTDRAEPERRRAEVVVDDLRRTLRDRQARDAMPRVHLMTAPTATS